MRILLFSLRFTFIKLRWAMPKGQNIMNTSIKTKHTKSLLNASGSFILLVGKNSVVVDLDNDQSAKELFLSVLDNSRKADTEFEFLKQIVSGNFAAARQYSSADAFEYPLSLQNYVSSFISLARAKGKVSPGSIEVIIKLEAGKDDIISMSDNLKHISGFHLVNEKPIPVTDSMGMPIAVKYIVSPLAK